MYIYTVYTAMNLCCYYNIYQSNGGSSFWLRTRASRSNYYRYNYNELADTVASFR